MPHSISCYSGSVERFIDHVRMYSVRADEEVEQHEGDGGGNVAGQYE